MWNIIDSFKSDQLLDIYCDICNNSIAENSSWWRSYNLNIDVCDRCLYGCHLVGPPGEERSIHSLFKSLNDKSNSDRRKIKSFCDQRDLELLKKYNCVMCKKYIQTENTWHCSKLDENVNLCKDCYLFVWKTFKQISNVDNEYMWGYETKSASLIDISPVKDRKIPNGLTVNMKTWMRILKKTIEVPHNFGSAKQWTVFPKNLKSSMATHEAFLLVDCAIGSNGRIAIAYTYENGYKIKIIFGTIDKYNDAKKKWERTHNSLYGDGNKVWGILLDINSKVSDKLDNLALIMTNFRDYYYTKFILAPIDYRIMQSMNGEFSLR